MRNITRKKDKIISGTRIGGLKAREANLKKNPNHYKEIGGKGGKKTKDELKSPKGFGAATPEQRSEWGRKGGLKSKLSTPKE